MKRVLLFLVTAALALSVSACGPFGDGTRTITAEFPDSAGLFVGNDVGVLGVPIGTVTKIVPDGTSVKVTMKVKASQPIPEHAGAAIVARSVATDRYVEITPVYSGGPKMADNAVIPASRTVTPVDFDAVLKSLNDFATGIGGSKESKDAVRRIVDSGAAALDGRGPLLNQTINNLGGATTTLSSQRQQFTDTLTSLDGLVNTIDTNQQTEREFINQVAAAADLLASQRTEFKQTLNALDSTVNNVAQFTTTNKDTITATLNKSSQLMQTVIGKQKQVHQALTGIPTALQNLQRASDHGVLPVRLDAVDLLPLGGLLKGICNALPLNLCNLIDGTGIVGQLGQILGLGGKQ